MRRCGNLHSFGNRPGEELIFMEQLVRVQKLNEDGTAQVLHIRQSACSGDCHKCSGCGAVQQKMLLTAYNPIHAQPGQVVVIRSESGPVLAAAAMLYMLPLLLFFAGYLVSLAIWQTGAVAGIVGFALGLVIAMVYDRKVMGKKKNIYTITGFGHLSQTPEKGDNDFD